MIPCTCDGKLIRTQHGESQAGAVKHDWPTQQLLQLPLHATKHSQLWGRSADVAYLTERQSSNGRGNVVAVGNGQHGSQQDEGGSNEVQPQTQPLVSCLQRPVCPANTTEKP